MNRVVYVGMDVHKDTYSCAVLMPDRSINRSGSSNDRSQVCGKKSLRLLSRQKDLNPVVRGDGLFLADH